MSTQERMEYETARKKDDGTIVRWTNIGFSLQGPGRILKINEKSFIVELLEDVSKQMKGRPTPYVWRRGQRIKVPRSPDATVENCISPPGGWSWERSVSAP